MHQIRKKPIAMVSLSVFFCLLFDPDEISIGSCFISGLSLYLSIFSYSCTDFCCCFSLSVESVYENAKREGHRVRSTECVNI